MGQKVNPYGMRIGITHNWKSQWFANKGAFARFFLDDQTIRNTVLKQFNRDAGIGLVEVKRDANQITLIIHTSKPGMIIGRAGAGIEALKKALEKAVKIDTKIKIDIHEIKNGDMWAAIVAQNIASQIERRISYRRASKQAIERTMGRGAKGIRIGVAGRLGGAEIARSEKFSQGSVPLSTFRADIDYAAVDAHTTFGVIGVKVWIYKGEKTRPEEA
jgi:small subunit ribosomal protein S3